MDGWHVCSTTCHSLQSGPADELLLQIHGRAYPDASGACYGSDDVLVQELYLDLQGHHVLACKKHTGATRGHNHVMDVLAQLARNTGYSVRVNHKVSRSTTAAASNKQGDVELVNFGFDGYNNLVIDVSFCCDHIGNSTINNGHLNGKMHTNDYLQARTWAKNIRYKKDYAAVGTAFAPAIM